MEWCKGPYLAREVTEHKLVVHRATSDSLTLVQNASTRPRGTISLESALLMFKHPRACFHLSHIPLFTSPSHLASQDLTFYLHFTFHSSPAARHISIFLRNLPRSSQTDPSLLMIELPSFCSSPRTLDDPEEKHDIIAICTRHINILASSFLPFSSQRAGLEAV